MPDAFADILGVQPPPPPAARFTDVLAAAFGGAPDRMGSYQKGLNAGGEFHLRSAQTESALAEADKRRGEALRQTQINDLVSRAQSDPNFKPTMSDLLTISTNANDFSNARLGDQEFGNRAVLADPHAAPDIQFAAGQGVQGRVLPHMYDVGGETVNQFSAPDATFETPAQKATVAATHALEGERNRSPANAATGGAPLIRSSPIGPVQSTDGGRTWAPVIDNRAVADYNAARTAGAATGPKQAALPANLNNLNAFESTIDDLLAHPGFNTIYGMSSIADPRNYIRGTDAQGANALRDQLNSRAFLASIQQMRGMGQLSNQEGAKVETALTAALKPGLSDDEAVLRFGELKQAIANLKTVAQQEAGATENVLTPPGAAPAPGAPRSFNSEAEAAAAGLVPGTRVTIGGVAGTWE